MCTHEAGVTSHVIYKIPTTLVNKRLRKNPKRSEIIDILLIEASYN
jgi:hypothetical protein